MRVLAYKKGFNFKNPASIDRHVFLLKPYKTQANLSMCQIISKLQMAFGKMEWAYMP